MISYIYLKTQKLPDPDHRRLSSGGCARLMKWMLESRQGECLAQSQHNVQARIIIPIKRLPYYVKSALGQSDTKQAPTMPLASAWLQGR